MGVLDVDTNDGAVDAGAYRVEMAVDFGVISPFVRLQVILKLQAADREQACNDYREGQPHRMPPKRAPSPGRALWPSGSGRFVFVFEVVELWLVGCLPQRFFRVDHGSARATLMVAMRTQIAPDVATKFLGSVLVHW